MTSLRALLALMAVAVYAAPAATATAEPTETRPSLVALLDQAFGQLFNYPSIRTVEMDVTRNGQIVAHRAFDMIYSRLEDRDRTLVRFTAPDYLRGTGLLVVESRGGASDAWLYQPEVGRLRRVGTHQKGDTFYGTDITYEDLEHHRWERFGLRQLDDGELNARPLHVLEAISPGDSSYAKLIVGIEKERGLLAYIDFFRRTTGQPVKRLEVFLDEVTKEDGYFKPSGFVVTQLGLDASTVVRFTRIEIQPTISKEIFTSIRLRREGEDLYQLVKRITKTKEP